MKMRRITIIIALALTIFPAFAQEGEKLLYTYDRIEWLNPWLSGNNMAAHTMNSSFLNDSLVSFTEAEAGAGYTTGGLKNIYDPASGIIGEGDIRSYMKSGKVYLYGSFGYSYDYERECTWRGLTDPYISPFMLADSIPGNTSLETYSISGGVSFPAGNKFSIGILAAYQASIFAKHKDLRNKNTLMDFTISPGILYNGGIFKAGLDLSYRRRTEKIEYMQVDESTEKYLFEIYGMWLYRSIGFSSAETSRLQLDNSVAGELGLEFESGSFKAYNSFAVTYGYGQQTETGYNNLRYGDTRTLRYEDRLTIMSGDRHKIEATVSLERMLGYKFLQRQEFDESSGIRVWVTYGNPVNSYVMDLHSAGLEYTYRMARNPWDISWEVTAGAKALSATRKAVEHPISFTQDLALIRPYLEFGIHRKYGRHFLDIQPGAAYTACLGGKANETANVSDTEIPESDTPWQLENELEKEYGFLSCDKAEGSVDIGYGYALSPQKGRKLNIGASYIFQTATGERMRGECRHHIRISVGITF